MIQYELEGLRSGHEVLQVHARSHVIIAPPTSIDNADAVSARSGRVCSGLSYVSEANGQIETDGEKGESAVSKPQAGRPS